MRGNGADRAHDIGRSRIDVNRKEGDCCEGERAAGIRD
jgi:hypothetical protein